MVGPAAQRQDAAKASPAEPSEFPSILAGKRLLLMTESLGPVNGVSRTTLSLIKYLRGNGVLVSVVAPTFEGQKNAIDGDQEVQLRLQGYPLPWNPDLTVVYPFRLDRLYERTIEPDLVYLASPASLGFQFLLQVRQLARPPPILLNFQTDLSAYSEILFPVPFDKLAVLVLQKTQGFLFSHPAVKTCFYPSSGVRRYLEDAGVPPTKLAHLGRGVDTELFNPSCRDEAYRRELAPNGEIIIVSVSRIAPEKGFEFLADVARRLATKGLPFKLVIVGGNRNPQVEQDVRQMFHGLEDNVIFTGFLGGSRLARAYASADISVHCSITETFGLVVLEAMACSIPVIARDEGGPSEIVNHGKTGYLVPPSDVDQFVRRVETLATQKELRNKMKDDARRQALDTTWEKINNRVAWRLAEAYEQNNSKALASSKFPDSWSAVEPYSILKAITGLVASLILILRMNASIGVVFFIWIVLIILYIMVRDARPSPLKR